MSAEIRLSFSSISTFQECRKRFQLRHLDRLIPIAWQDEEPFVFGRLVDVALQFWLDGWSSSAVFDWLEQSTRLRHVDEFVMERYCRAHAMLSGYFAAHPRSQDGFIVVWIQPEFTGPILNPSTGAPSKLLELTGRPDALILLDGELWIYELKTASRLDADYLESLWNSPQTGLYAVYVERELGIPVAGVLYDLLEKAPSQTRRRAGESEEEYRTRAAAAAAANKSGKTSAKRQLPETWDEYRARLTDLHTSNLASMYRREQILISEDRLRDVREQLWSVGQDLIAARRGQTTFYRNHRACRSFGRECEYLPICRSGDNPVLIQNLYTREDPGHRHSSQPAFTPTTATHATNATTAWDAAPSLEPVPF